MRSSVRHAAYAAAVAIISLTSGAEAVVTYTDLYSLGMPAGFVEARAEGNSPTSGGKAVGYGYGSATGNQNHALLWNATSIPIDLNPGGFTFSRASSTDGNQHVGDGYGTATGQVDHAVLWNGTTAASAIDLHPATGYQQSAALGVGGGFQVGEAVATGGNYHAVLWHGTNAVIDLHPASGFTRSAANGVGDGQQVGYAYGPATGDNNHALLWTGFAASVVDLHPASGFTVTTAYGVGGGQQVGSGYGSATGGSYHALLWNGTNSAIDLHPGSAFNLSAAFDADGGKQVGYGRTPSFLTHALLWDDTAASVVDLQNVLPASFQSSYAYSISGGTVYGVAYDTNGNAHAIAWTVPEPTGVTLLACGAGLLLRRRTRAATPPSIA
jgi:hypothetical protein